LPLDADIQLPLMSVGSVLHIAIAAM
jgi:hypothetical protein